MAKASVVAAEDICGLEADLGRHDVFQQAVMVALRDVNFSEGGREVPEEYIHVPSLTGRHLRDQMLHIAEDDDATRPATGRNLCEFAPHRLRPARNVDALFTQLLLESYMEVGDHERVIRHEDRFIRDRFEVHTRSKGRVRLITVRAD